MLDRLSLQQIQALLREDSEHAIRAACDVADVAPRNFPDRVARIDGVSRCGLNRHPPGTGVQSGRWPYASGGLLTVAPASKPGSRGVLAGCP
ncbi:MAG TPA: hypothetical protein VKA44_03070 [Gemmatimonadota bacterium]|nr:hypothetical protein [Gemmatimonadota bacterium]